MENNQIKAVLFDCWDTVIRFREKDHRWNLLPLYYHALNREAIDWNAVQEYAESIFTDYYSSRLKYEFTIGALHELLVRNFDIRLDCKTSETGAEVLNHLDPCPVEGIQDFLTFLEDNRIPYAIASNTIYPEDVSLELVKKLVPESNFEFFLGSGAVGMKKPNPLFFRTASHMIGQPLERCCYIGDAYLQDVCGSQMAGFGLSVWLNHKHHRKDEYTSAPGFQIVDCPEITSYADLIRYFQAEVLK